MPNDVLVLWTVRVPDPRQTLPTSYLKQQLGESKNAEYYVVPQVRLDVPYFRSSTYYIFCDVA